MKNSSKTGKITSKKSKPSVSVSAKRKKSECSVQGISQFGIWLMFDGREYFLKHSDFPWFEKASIKSVFNLKKQGKKHLYWPDLDIDLHLDSIEFPESYPLVSK